jgi:glutamine cyclotransferase
MSITRRALLAAMALLAKTLPTRQAKVETVFKTPGPQPNGLQATGDGLWILDQGNNHAYLVEYESGKVLRDLKTDSVAGSGITFDGQALWLASTYSSEIIRTDAHTGQTLEKHPTPGAGIVSWTVGRRSPLAKAAPAGAATSTAPRKPTGAHGLEWRNSRLWIAVPPAKTVYRMNPATWQIEQQFPSMGDRPHGIGWQGQWLWLTESNDNAFYKVDPKTGQAHEKIQLADTDPLPHGMSIRGGVLWYCDDVGVVCRLKL